MPPITLALAIQSRIANPRKAAPATCSSTDSAGFGAEPEYARISAGANASATPMTAVTAALVVMSSFVLNGDLLVSRVRNSWYVAGGACGARSRSEEEAMRAIVDDERRGDRAATSTSPSGCARDGRNDMPRISDSGH